MANLDRILELAGLKDKSLHVTQLHEKTLEQLEHEKLCYEQQIKGASIVTEALAGIRLKLFRVEQVIAAKKEALAEAAKAADSFDQGKVACANCNKSIHNAATCTCKCHEENGLSKIEEDAELNEKAPEDQENFVKSSKNDFKKRYGKQWKKVLYATAWKRHNEGLEGDSLDVADKLFEDELIAEAKDAAALQDSQPTAAQEKGDIDNLFNGHDEEKADADKLHQDAQGVTQDRETKVSVPRDVFSQIDQRIKELKQSIELYDKTTYKEQYGNKQKAIENLEFIREKLKMGNMEGYKQAQIHYGTLASIYAGNLFPAKLVDFLHDGQASEKREVAFGDAFKGDKNKPTEGEVPGNAIYKTLNTSIYPQKGEDNVPKK